MAATQKSSDNTSKSNWGEGVRVRRAVEALQAKTSGAQKDTSYHEVESPKAWHTPNQYVCLLVSPSLTL